MALFLDFVCLLFWDAEHFVSGRHDGTLKAYLVPEQHAACWTKSAFYPPHNQTGIPLMNGGMLDWRTEHWIKSGSKLERPHLLQSCSLYIPSKKFRTQLDWTERKVFAALMRYTDSHVRLALHIYEVCFQIKMRCPAILCPSPAILDSLHQPTTTL